TTRAVARKSTSGRPGNHRIIGTCGISPDHRARAEGRNCMRIPATIALAAVAAAVAMAGSPALAPGVGKYLAPRDQVAAPRALRPGKRFEARSGALAGNKVIVIRGDRIADVGASVEIPAGATVIDLSNATVLPGMIDVHVHVNTGGDNMARRTLRALANAQI